MSRGLGWVRGLDPTEELREASAAHIGAAIERAGAHGPQGGIGRAPWILDQLGQSCTMHFGAAAVYGLTGFQGSPYLPYPFARLFDHPGEPLRDVGVSVRGFMHALEHHGMCPWGAWNPGSPGFDLNVLPPGPARVMAQRHNLDIVPIYATGSDAVTAMVDALAQGLPGGVVLEVDGGYESPGVDGVVGPQKGASRGKHEVALWRFRTVGGRYQFLSPGSWGRGFGIEGSVWLDEDRIAESEFLCFARSVS